MPFDWNNYLTFAEELAGRVDEASMRSAISRAYYCVFNLAFARAELTAGRRPSGERYHKWCWATYQRAADASCRQLGTNGKRMQRRREKADYQAAQNPRLDDEVRLMLSEARKFQADLAALDRRYPLP